MLTKSEIETIHENILSESDGYLELLEDLVTFALAHATNNN